MRLSIEEVKSEYGAVLAYSGDKTEVWLDYYINLHETIIAQQQEIEQLKKAVGEWKYEAECHMDEVIASKKENEKLRSTMVQAARGSVGIVDLAEENVKLLAQAATMREALNEAISIITRGRLTSIGSFHNTYDSQISTFFIDKWTAALENAGKDYHNPADVEALRQAREALIYCKISACKPAKGVAEVAIATIDKALGGNEDA